MHVQLEGITPVRNGKNAENRTYKRFLRFALSLCSFVPQCLCGYESIMQNKANLLDTQMSVSSVKTKYYENKRLCSRGKNKPNQTQFKALKEMVKTSAGFFQHLAPRICYNIAYLISKPKEWGRVIWRRTTARKFLHRFTLRI